MTNQDIHSAHQEAVNNPCHNEATTIIQHTNITFQAMADEIDFALSVLTEDAFTVLTKRRNYYKTQLIHD
jgi:hypothetical protein